MNKGVFIIAEAGVNHNGDINLAKKLVICAKEAGADAVKFQMFKTEKLVTKQAEKANYQNDSNNSKSQFDMLKKLELSYEDFMEISEYCKKNGIMFMSTAFDLDSIDELKKIGTEINKVPSGEINNLPYLEKISKISKSLIVSTGMSTINEIKEAVNIIRKNSSTNIIVLHCNTEYPTPYQDVNLKAMVQIGKELGVDVGYSDHTEGVEVCVAAVALGAKIIEKHFTLDKHMVGPDHKASLEPNELKTMIREVRNIEEALGSDNKVVSKSEKKNISVVRKSIVANKKILKGEILTAENITTKRPGTGLSPMKWYEVLGTKAIKNFEVDELIII
ncbi:MAG: N-acetylneuraminate synthase [Erysipelotrichaceae bacterium]